MMKPKLYVALGDSMSIDYYPDFDAASRFPENAFSGLGAASLFYKNHDEAWPEFQGCDLVGLYGKKLAFCALASDGATTDTVIAQQLPALPAAPKGLSLVTVTAGGNDLLENLYYGGEAWRTVLQKTAANLNTIVAHLRKKYDGGQIILNSVYDPTDGTGQLEEGRDILGLLPRLEEHNHSVRRCAEKWGCLFVDVHEHFFSHGCSEPESARRWFWEESIIEPNALGASEIRRLWLEIIEEAF